MSDGLDIAREIAMRGAEIERTKAGRALTADEATTVRAGNFLRQIAPYLFTDQKAEGAK